MTDRARARRVRCRAVTTISATEVLTLTTISDDAHPDGGRLSCELAAGHGGSHVALVATAHGGDQWWWLRWDGELGNAIELIQIDPCDAELPQGRYKDDCFLPDGHPGPHSFDLPPPPSLSRERHPFRLRPHTR